MRRLFLLVALIFLLTGCKEDAVLTTQTPDPEIYEAPLTGSEEVEPLIPHPQADEATVELVLDFPDDESEYNRESVPADMFIWGDYLPVISYTSAKGEEVRLILDSNMKALSEGAELYKRAEGLIPAKKPSVEILYPDSTDNGYTETTVCSVDGSRMLYKLTLPSSDYFVSGKYNGCELKSVLDGRLIIEFFKQRKGNGGQRIKEYSSFFIYDAENGEYECLHVDGELLSASPDGKYFVTVSSMGNNRHTLSVCGLDIRFDTAFEADGGDLSVVDWVSKGELYSEMNEEPPVQQRTPIPFPEKSLEADTPEKPAAVTVELDSDDSDADRIKVGLHKDVTDAGSTELPKSCDASGIDFGRYVPFFVGYYESHEGDYYEKIPIPMGAFINEEVDTLEEGKALYHRVNERYSTSDKMMIDGEAVDVHPAKAERIVDVTSDFGRVLVSDYDKYIIYENGNAVRTADRYLYEERESVENDAPTYDVLYSADGEEIYRDDRRVFFLDGKALRVYSRDTLKLVRSVDFSYTGDNKSVKLWTNYMAYTDAIEVVDGRYVFVSYSRDVNHEGDCTCGTRGVVDKALCRYDLETDEYELIADSYQTYSISPDGRYIAYTFNCVSSGEDDMGWYELFEGYICIRELDGERVLVLPYTEKGYGEFSLPTALWRAVEWVEADKLDEVLSRPAVEGVVLDCVVLPSVDGDTVVRTVKFTGLTPPETETEHSLTFGDYLPMVRYGTRELTDNKCFYNYSILSDGMTTVEQGEELYCRINEKYKESFAVPHGITATDNNGYLTEKLFASRLIYLSTDLKNAVTFALHDKGSTSGTDWKDHLWSGEYKIMSGDSEEIKALTSLDIGSLEDGGLTDPFGLIDGRVYRFKKDGRLYSESYRDSEWAVFTLYEMDTVNYTYTIKHYVYSISDNKITHVLVDEREDGYTTRISQIIGGRYLVINRHRSGYLYDLEKDELRALYYGDASCSASPDMKYIIECDIINDYQTRLVRYKFIVNDLETGRSYSLNSSPFAFGRYLIGDCSVISWLSREKLEEFLK